LNVINQLVIGAKEGVIKAVSKLVGSNITNAILGMANGSNHKSINNFMLYNVMKVAIDGSDRPSTNDALEQLLKVINHIFDFCKKVSVNMELMQSNAARMAMYGYPTAHAHTVGQHQDSHQIRLRMQILLGHPRYP
jgi:hypothetical protein